MKYFDENQSTQKIAQLNDALRTSLTGGRLMVTAGVSALPPSTQVDILRAVQAFDSFTPDNDPHGEHDFGRVEIGDCFVFPVLRVRHGPPGDYIISREELSSWRAGTDRAIRVGSPARRRRTAPLGRSPGPPSPSS